MICFICGKEINKEPFPVDYFAVCKPCLVDLRDRAAPKYQSKAKQIADIEKKIHLCSLSGDDEQVLELLREKVLLQS